MVRKRIAEKDRREVPKTTTVVVTFNICIGKGEAHLKQFKKLIGLALWTIKENLDEHVCFVPLKDEVTGSIKLTQDIPKLILGFPKFFHIPNIRAFNSTQQTSQMIKGSAQMSFSVKDSKTCLEQADADLINMDYGIHYKKVQEVLTDSGTILLGAPMSMSKEEVDKVFNAELMKFEKGATLQEQWKLNLKFPKNMLQACCGRVKMI